MHKSLKSSRKRMEGRLQRKHVKSGTRAFRVTHRKLKEKNLGVQDLTGLKDAYDEVKGKAA